MRYFLQFSYCKLRVVRETEMNVIEAIHSRHSYRGKFKDAPVPKEDLMKIMQAGLDAHLSKPVEPEVLFETLEQLVK